MQQLATSQNRGGAIGVGLTRYMALIGPRAAGERDTREPVRLRSIDLIFRREVNSMGDLIKFPGNELRLGLPAQRLQATVPQKPMSDPAEGICWACGIGRTIRGEKYCRSCIVKGADTPIISCGHDGCTLVTKRWIRGQQTFWCREHRSERHAR